MTERSYVYCKHGYHNFVRLPYDYIQVKVDETRWMYVCEDCGTETGYMNRKDMEEYNEEAREKRNHFRVTE